LTQAGRIAGSKAIRNPFGRGSGSVRGSGQKGRWYPRLLPKLSASPWILIDTGPHDRSSVSPFLRGEFFLLFPGFRRARGYGDGNGYG